VNEGAGDYSERATCANDGTFTWTKTYLTGDQGDKTLNLQAYDLAANAITGATASVDVRVDNTAPAAPTLVAPASSPYDFTGSGTSFTVQLGAAGDVVRVTGPASVQLTFNSPNYEYVVPLSAGVSSSYTFYAYDLAGNQSAGTSLTISYVPAASLIIGGAFLGGSVTDSGTNYGLEATLSPVPSRAVDSGTSYILETGFNYIMNQVRAD